ncbi:class I SAM-dependent methyltransferase [Phytoactinopolyspora halotolerans]|uniref:Class I SAM-dependent methyltransferase n=1 Tax=Phytoactinopolyspora halotolerans TaxID=1981512 RepID=A0A6L9SBZ3_9ACTN|nr:class I SAM-dependent methyltransferase [Phytoactinopolyspora halotolerans]
MTPRAAPPTTWLLDGLPGRRPGHALDIACGSAPLHPRLAAADSYLGVDISEGELALARERGRGPVVRADARRLPTPSDSVDTVVSSMRLMLVTPLADALHEITRVLRRGGTVAALVPARWPLRLRDAQPLFALATSLRGLGTMPQHRRRRPGRTGPLHARLPGTPDRHRHRQADTPGTARRTSAPTLAHRRPAYLTAALSLGLLPHASTAFRW